MSWAFFFGRAAGKRGYDAAPQTPPEKMAGTRPASRRRRTARQRPRALTLTDDLQKILTARVTTYWRNALQPARGLSRRLGNQVLLKREDSQPVFSFKLRGAYNKMAHLGAEQLARRHLRVGRQPCPGRGAERGSSAAARWW